MIHSLSGTISGKGPNFLVVDVHGVGLKVYVSERNLGLGAEGSSLALFTHLHVKEDALDLYGFPSESELSFFEQLISVSGVGPKSALSIMDVSDLKNIIAAIKEGRPDLLTQASGIGRKTAERIIVELRGKVSAIGAESIVRGMESDADILEALAGLGYRKDAARSALDKIPAETKGTEARLKEALKILSKNKNA